MSRSDPPLNPFASGPVGGPADGHPYPQNPFQIEGGNEGVRPSSPSPFEAVDQQVSSQIHAPATPFEIVEGQVPQQQEQVGGGFPMKGFPPGPAPVEQLAAAPIQASSQPESPQQQEAAPLPMADPFAGMNLPHPSGDPEEASASEASPMEDNPVEEFAAPVMTESDSAPVSNPDPEPLPKQQEKEREEPSSPPQAKEEKSITGETRQLELRAIFGVDHELSHQEIMQRMRGLPGILHVAKVSSPEVEALGILQGCTSKLGVKEDDPIIMTCSQGLIDFLEYEGTSLAVLRKDNYFPGVRETLFICARELSKL